MLNAPEGTSLSAMDEALLAVEAELKQMPEIKLILGTAGSFFRDLSTRLAFISGFRRTKSGLSILPSSGRD